MFHQPHCVCDRLSRRRFDLRWTGFAVRRLEDKGKASLARSRDNEVLAGAVWQVQRLVRNIAVGEPVSASMTDANPKSILASPRQPVRPSIYLLAAEIPRLMLIMATSPFHVSRLAAAPRGDGRPIMVIPGFGAGDSSTAVLRGYLRWLGYDAVGWGLGRNLGAATIGRHNEVLLRRIDRLYRRHGAPLTLVGWSMGGIMARMVARRRPHAIAEVFCLAAPFTGHPFANHGWRTYERISGHSLRHPVARQQIMESRRPLPVRSTSIYSKSDGVVHWECCLEPESGAGSHNIEVVAPHIGFGFDPLVLRTLADCLQGER
jgi:hypothetical protein